MKKSDTSKQAKAKEQEQQEIEGWEPFAWKHNALRHSFISYRLAAVQNMSQVALEVGNSPQMILKHYRELVRPADADLPSLKLRQGKESGLRSRWRWWKSRKQRAQGGGEDCDAAEGGGVRLR